MEENISNGSLYNNTSITLNPSWTSQKKIAVNDICTIESTGKEYFCFRIITHEKLDYIYLSSFDFNEYCFGVQTEDNNINYIRSLSDESEQKYALHLLKYIHKTDSGVIN